MSDDGAIYVALLTDFDSWLVCGAYTSLEGAIDCLERSGQKDYYRWANVLKMPLDADFDHLREEAAYSEDVTKMLGRLAAAKGMH